LSPLCDLLRHNIRGNGIDLHERLSSNGHE
jgi:hypothetical protein